MTNQYMTAFHEDPIIRAAVMQSGDSMFTHVVMQLQVHALTFIGSLSTNVATERSDQQDCEQHELHDGQRLARLSAYQVWHGLATGFTCNRDSVPTSHR